MEYTVTGAEHPVDFGASGTSEILQNVRTVLTTTQGTVPLDRSFGIDQTPLDRPLPVARTLLVAKIIEAITTHEPRVEVIRVDFEENGITGELIPRVIIRLKEGVTA